MMRVYDAVRRAFGPPNFFDGKPSPRAWWISPIGIKRFKRRPRTSTACKKGISPCSSEQLTVSHPCVFRHAGRSPSVLRSNRFRLFLCNPTFARYLNSKSGFCASASWKSSFARLPRHRLQSEPCPRRNGPVPLRSSYHYPPSR
jgi:hypothetical protein